uniref:C-type lectin domain-containing protein n=1 Tax=Esox lucius TaxID=8010 RepID=A0AAY5L3D5_ESOLU
MIVPPSSPNPTPTLIPWKSYLLAAVGCLGLLCVLLLAGIIGLVLQLRNQLTGYNVLITERDQLYTSYNNLTKERDRLKQSLVQKGCPKRWERFGSSCYYLSGKDSNWMDSREDCLERGADLVIISSPEEQTFVSGLKPKGRGVWIGLKGSVTNATWTWVDGTTMTTSAFCLQVLGTKRA